MKEELIRKYVRGMASIREKEELFEWIEQDEKHAEIFHSMHAEWVFDNLPYIVAPEDSYTVIKKRISPPLSTVSLLLRAAAVLLFPVLMFSAYQYVTYSNKLKTLNEDAIFTRSDIPEQTASVINYKVNPGVKGIVDLPDGSRVWLNSNSNLVCPAEFDSTFRMVELNGEGYFNIVSDYEWPMYVRTSKGITVRVTGTEFNVSSYENDDELTFTLVSGAVTLIRESTRQEIPVGLLEEVVIPDDNSNKGSRRRADLTLNTAWKDGYLVFDNSSMGEVIKKMERWYGVQINVEDPQIYTYAFTATFMSESITQVLHLLELTSNIGYAIKDNEVTLFLRR